MFLSDILPTGYQAAVNAEVGMGSTVAIFGAGPVGLMTAACARMLGADRVFMIDHHQYRLANQLRPQIDDPARQEAGGLPQGSPCAPLN